MKKLFFIIAFFGITIQSIHAQSSQRKTLLQQIAALEIYIDYAQKGYSTVRKGLNAVGGFKKGELNLHSDYFTSLKIVNPKIKRYARVGEIIALQVKIIKGYRTIHNQIRQDDLFHGDEIRYIERVFDRLIDNCDDNLNDLLRIVKDSELEMKDDQRIGRIDAIHTKMLENHTFCEAFSNQTRLIHCARAKETKETKTSRILHGINDHLP